MPKSKDRRSTGGNSANTIRREILGDTGYGHPPESTRFKKGQSGNPAGRPSKTRDLAVLSATNAMLLAEAEQPIRIVENGKERKITAKEAVVKAQIRTAVRGNSYAQERLLSRIEKAERERAANIDAANAAATNYVAACRADIKSARESGLPEPEEFPHPDDVVIIPGQPFQILGPTNKEEANIYDKAARTRDLFIMQATLAPLPREHEFSAELFFAIRLNAALPPRMQLDDNAWFLLDWRSRRTPRRQLEKQIQAEWRNLGVEAPRRIGFLKLDREQLKRQLKTAMEGAA